MGLFRLLKLKILLRCSSVSVYKTKHYIYKTHCNCGGLFIYLSAKSPETLRSWEGEISWYDKEVMKRIEDIDKLDPATKEHLFFLVDNMI